MQTDAIIYYFNVCFILRSGLEQDDMRVMYRYLTTSLFPSTMEQEMQGSQAAPSGSTPSNMHYGKSVYFTSFA